MVEYIKRQDAIDAVGKAYRYESDRMTALQEVPVADVRENIHGEWKHLGGDEWVCTACGNVIHTEGSWEKPTKKFCEECGADMRKEQEDEY